VKAHTWGPLVGSIAVVIVLGCSSEDGGSGGCGSSAAETCDINVEATICGDWITVECFGGATPSAGEQCEKALEEEDESVYCCASAAQPAETAVPAAGGGGAVGAGGVSGAGGAGGAGGGL